MCVWVLGVAHLVFVIGIVLRCSVRLEKPVHELLAAPARALGAGGAPKQLFLQLLTRGSGFAQRAFVGIFYHMRGTDLSPCTMARALASRAAFLASFYAIPR